MQKRDAASLPRAAVSGSCAELLCAGQSLVCILPKLLPSMFSKPIRRVTSEFHPKPLEAMKVVPQRRENALDMRPRGRKHVSVSTKT